MPIRIMRETGTYPVVDATAMGIYPKKRGLFGPRDGSLTAENYEGEWIFRVICPEKFRPDALRRGYAACLKEARRKRVHHLLIHLLRPKTGGSLREELKLALDTLHSLPETGEMDIYLFVPSGDGLDRARRKDLEDYLRWNLEPNFGMEAAMEDSQPFCPPMPMPPMAAPMAMPSMAPSPKKSKIPMEVDAGFSETLLSLIDKTGKKDSEIYNKANVSRQHFSKIRNNPDYKPTKTTAIAFAIALELDLEQTRDLIGRAGYALTRSSKFDLIIMYFIDQKNYNLFDINEALYEYDQSLLGV